MKHERFPFSTLSRAWTLSNVALGLALPAAAQAVDPWEMRATAQSVYGSYNDAALRDSLYGVGFFLGGDYLEKGGFVLGYTYTEVEGKGAGPGSFDTLEEDALYLSGRLHSYADTVPGKLTWRLDTYLINDDSSGDGNRVGADGAGADTDIGVVHPMISFLNQGETRGFDLGYAYSDYDGDGERGGDFQAHQLTPTVGFALGSPADWLQIRGYFIHLSDDDLNDGNNDTVAVEAKWTHWFGPGAPLSLHSVGLNGMVGERFLAVDPDAAVVYTLADEQRGTAGVNGVWQLGENTSVMLQGGYERYENRAIDNDYDSIYVYANLSHRW